MKIIRTLLAALLVVMGFTLSAEATLIDRGGLFYDSDLNITWLQNANLAATNTFGVGGISPSGEMTWYTAQSWIAAMNAANYLGYSDWRLPTALNQDGTGPCSGSNCSGSELGHLYYMEFSNPQNAGLHLINYDGLSSNFWTSTEYSSTEQATLNKNPRCSSCPTFIGETYAWAVRNGDSGPNGASSVPEPSTLFLLGSGLTGLVAMRRFRKM